LKYLGNKARITDFLSASMNLVARPGQKALDLFCGTGSVSTLFKKAGISTVSNDLLACASTYTEAKLLDIAPPPLRSLESTTLEGFIWENYAENAGVSIFNDTIAKHIDGSRHSLELHRGTLSRSDYIYYLAQIIEAADFRSNIMGSYESFYKKGWRKQALVAWSLPPLDLVDMKGLTTHHVYNEAATDLLESVGGNYDFVYMDPPYNTRQYASVFHVLETICLADGPVVAGRVNKRGAWPRSDFSSKRSVASAFERIVRLAGLTTDELFDFYSNEGILSAADLDTIIKSVFPKTQIFQQSYRRFKTNSRRKNAPTKVKEILINGTK